MITNVLITHKQTYSALSTKQNILNNAYKKTNVGWTTLGLVQRLETMEVSLFSV